MDRFNKELSQLGGDSIMALEQYKKDLISKYWNDEFEQQLEKVLEENLEMREIFQAHPELKEAYKFKILDSQPLEDNFSPPDDIVCKTCLFRLPPLNVGGTPYERHTVPFCKIYEQPESKPYEILREGASCEYYEPDKRLEK